MSEQSAGQRAYERGVVEFVQLDRIPVVKELKNAYEYREDRPMRWLQRLCCWMLGKLGCYASLESVRIERHVIGKHGRTFMTRLLEQREHMIQELNNSPERLLIGAEDYASLMGETISTMHWSFDAEYFKGNGDGRPKMCGMRIEVVPWMRGMLVMP